jgi:hypothetical protein
LTLSLSASSRFSLGSTALSNALAERLQVSVEIVNRILDGWPSVFSDSERRIVG